MTTWILQISAGTGPAPVRAFVKHLGDRLQYECLQRGLDVISVSTHGPEICPCSIEIGLDGDAPAVLASLVGTHVLIARTGARGRRSRKRWFAGVSLHRAPTETDAVWPSLDDLDISTCRAGGPGGQHVNKTSSAVRVVHRPSGIAVRASGERSQVMNRKQAIARIAGILARRRRQRQTRDSNERRLAHYHFERGSAVQVWVESASGTSRIRKQEML